MGTSNIIRLDQPQQGRAVSESEAAFIVMQIAKTRPASYGWKVSELKLLGLPWAVVLERLQRDDDESWRATA